MTVSHHTNRTTILRLGIAAAALFALVVLVSAALAGGIGSREGRDAGPVGDSAQDAEIAGNVTVLGRMPSRVPESSGVAVSAVHPGILWTHSDGAEGRLHAIAYDGRWRASASVPGAGAVDWEDVARGPCPADGGTDGCLFIADTGDNDASRETARILVVPEPARLEVEGTVRPLATVDFRYPGGPTDAEALAIGGDGRALIVSKGNDGAVRLYELPPEAFTTTSGTGVLEARLVATLPIDTSGRAHRVTGAAMSPDGGTLAVRTASEVYLFPLGEWTREPRVCATGKSQPQGEAVAYLDAERLVLTSEGADSPILAVRCP